MKTKKNILDDNLSLKKIPFTVPTGYFEAMGDRAEAAVRSAASSAARHGNKVLVAVLSTAACAAAVLVTAALLFYGFKGNPADDYYASDAGSSLTQEDIVEYLIESGVSLGELANF